MNLPQRYIDLLIRHLTGYQLDNCADHPDEVRERGADWPTRALSMIGVIRMRQLANAVDQVIANGVPGDLMECGVWRGGACILMRAMLDVRNVVDRPRGVWVADSFAGLPPPDAAKWPEDEGDTHHRNRELAVSIDQVKANFEREGWLDDRVNFLPGWFEESLPGPVKQLALLRLDGDMYGSIYTCMDSLYPLVSPGGIVIIDDWFQPRPQKAVRDWMAAHDLPEPAVTMTADGNTGWWVKR